MPHMCRGCFGNLCHLDVSAVRAQMRQKRPDDGVRHLCLDCSEYFYECVSVKSHSQISPLAGVHWSLQQDSFLTGMESHQPLSVAHQSRERPTVSTVNCEHLRLSLSCIFFSFFKIHDYFTTFVLFLIASVFCFL